MSAVREFRPTGRSRSYLSFTTTVDIDADELRRDGWHHEDDCPANVSRTGSTDLEVLERAVELLHLQAHTDQSPRPALCLLEPCRTLNSDAKAVRL
ncbi:hypothetical protein [Enterococcus hirae]|uniref:hypothetical protein n=1 Tax=Enterococcus hirae TaxID=1354 RepID=UPI001368ADBA|nr:hypothetical protein [Enterococcus hirae]NAE18007.1 hypothetical protein [Enterococcus hirae]